MKNDVSQSAERRILGFMKGLGHPIRLGIVKKLLDQSGRCTCGPDCEGATCKCGCRCGEIVESFDMSQSTISQHIKELTKSGLINMNGRKGEYTLNHSNLTESLILLLDFLGYKTENIMENTKCNCGDNCQCGEDCQCRNGGECTCGDDCQCRNGGECTCGDDCQCRNGGECTCGDDCQCR